MSNSAAALGSAYLAKEAQEKISFLREKQISQIKSNFKHVCSPCEDSNFVIKNFSLFFFSPFKTIIISIIILKFLFSFRFTHQRLINSKNILKKSYDF